MRVIQDHQAPFAVRSGGHSPNPGWASVSNPGILVDLSKLNEISISDDHSTVSVGPGQNWGNVYEELDTYGVSVVGGREPQVGVEGLVLGGTQLAANVDTIYT